MSVNLDKFFPHPFSVSNNRITNGIKNIVLNAIIEILNSAGNMKNADTNPKPVMKAAINKALYGLFLFQVSDSSGILYNLQTSP